MRAPDGYTFCILHDESIAINPHIQNTGFDPKKSLHHVTQAFYLTQVFAVNASLGAKNFDELARLCQGQPKTLNYMAPSLVEGRVHGGVQQEARHRLRPRAVQGRRRRRQQHADRHDAGRDFRHRQPGPVHPHRTRSSALRSTATSARRLRPTSRPSGRSATPSISGRRRSASMRRPARRSRSSTR